MQQSSHELAEQEALPESAVLNKMIRQHDIHGLAELAAMSVLEG